jgi:PII-like signaling protein
VKLSVYFGENDRAGRDSLSDALLDLFATRRLQASVLLHGIEGFGAKQHLHSQRLLTLSEDLPLVATAVDTRERIEAVLPEVEAIVAEGLVTLEHTGDELPDGDVKLTVYCGRKERSGGRPAFVTVVDLMRRHGVEGATVLLGVDGTMHGERRRARFFASNADVPLMIVAIGPSERVGAAVAELDGLLERPLVTLERVSSRPVATPWEKLSVYTSRPLHLELVRRLRAAGAAGATCQRGIWGYAGDQAPHGDRLLALRREVPVVTTIVDDAARTPEWFELASAMTRAGGLVTREGLPFVSVHKGKRGPGSE